jgi:ATP-dependent RNA helicase DeaD
MDVPSIGDINEQRMKRFKQRILDTLATEDLDIYYRTLKDLQRENDVEPLNIAAALAFINAGTSPLLLKESEKRPTRERSERREFSSDDSRPPRRERGDRPERGDRSERGDRPERGERRRRDDDEDMSGMTLEKYRVEVGRQNDVKPGQIVGAIANEANISSRFIGSIDIFDDHTLVDLPAGMPNEVLAILQRAIVCGKPMAMTRVGGGKSGDWKNDSFDGAPRKRNSTANRKAAKSRSGKDGKDNKKPHRKGK